MGKFRFHETAVAIAAGVLLSAEALTQTQAGAPLSYTVRMSPEFYTCLDEVYEHELLPPSVDNVREAVREICPDDPGRSLYHWVINHRLQDEGATIPAGHVIAQRVVQDLVITPCDGEPIPIVADKIEYFRQVSPDSVAPDNQLLLTCCRSEVRPGDAVDPSYSDMHATTFTFSALISTARIVDLPPVTVDEHARVIGNGADSRRYNRLLTEVFSPNESMYVVWQYEYDNCDPVELPDGCSDPNHHYLRFRGDPTPDPSLSSAAFPRAGYCQEGRSAQ